MTTIWTRLLPAAAVAVLLACSPPLSAQNLDEAERIGAERFDAFMLQAADPCALKPAEVCIGEAWSYADRDRDGELAAGELAAIKNEMNAWAEWKKPALGQRDRASLAIAQMLVRSLPPSTLIEGFDSNANGRLSEAELTQDLALDGRPLPEILQDRASVDWSAMQQRLGPIAPLLSLLAQAQGGK